jgi:hypothetical protein
VGGSRGPRGGRDQLERTVRRFRVAPAARGWPVRELAAVMARRIASAS